MAHCIQCLSVCKRQPSPVPPSQHCHLAPALLRWAAARAAAPAAGSAPPSLLCVTETSAWFTREQCCMPGACRVQGRGRGGPRPGLRSSRQKTQPQNSCLDTKEQGSRVGQAEAPPYSCVKANRGSPCCRGKTWRWQGRPCARRRRRGKDRCGRSHVPLEPAAAHLLYFGKYVDDLRGTGSDGGGSMAVAHRE